MKYKVEMDCRVVVEVMADNEEQAISLAKRVGSSKKFFWKGEAKTEVLPSAEVGSVISKITADLNEAKKGLRYCNNCRKFKDAKTFKKDNWKNMICKECQ